MKKSISTSLDEEIWKWIIIEKINKRNLQKDPHINKSREIFFQRHR